MSILDSVPAGHSTHRIPAVVTTISFHRVTEYDDSGRGRCIGSFLNRTIAALAARGKGGWGSDGGIEDVTLHVVAYVDPTTGREVMREIGSNVSLEFLDADPQVAGALSKLGPAEVDALMKTLFR